MTIRRKSTDERLSELTKCPLFQPSFDGVCHHYYSDEEVKLLELDNNCRVYGLNKCDPTTGELEGKHNLESLR